MAIAARLAENANMTVAVIEAGESGDDVERQIDVPGNSYLDGLTGVRLLLYLSCPPVVSRRS